MLKYLSLAGLAALIFATAAYASSPGMSEGPGGCDWEAVVICSSKEAGVKMSLAKMHGSCMMNHGYCGKAGDDVTAPLGDKDLADYGPGKTVHVWITGDSETKPNLVASLVHPECSTAPIVP